MSVKIMSKVFDMDQDLKSSDKFVLLAMADHADHDGAGVYPGNERLARKTNYSVKTVSNAINRLKQKGILQKEQGANPGAGRATEWKIIPEAISPEKDSGKVDSGKTEQDSGKTPEANSSQPLCSNRYDNRKDNNTHANDEEQNNLDGLDWLLDLWAEQQPHEPSRQEKENQAKWAPKLLKNYERDELSEAVKGMNEMFKFSDEGWSLKKVDKNFTEARGAYNTDGDEGSDDKPVPSYMEKAN